MDFGIARALDDIGATMTNTWNVVGTAQYLSPEQATGEYADVRSDIYSVGCLMYELLVEDLHLLAILLYLLPFNMYLLL